jgi:hypothetical protein
MPALSSVKVGIYWKEPSNRVSVSVVNCAIDRTRPDAGRQKIEEHQSEKGGARWPRDERQKQHGRR